MPRDPIVDEVRRVREVEAAKYGFDVKAILAASKGDNAAPGTRLYRLCPGRS
jgi:hypothetical protein